MTEPKFLQQNPREKLPSDQAQLMLRGYVGQVPNQISSLILGGLTPINDFQFKHILLVFYIVLITNDIRVVSRKDYYIKTRSGQLKKTQLYMFAIGRKYDIKLVSNCNGFAIRNKYDIELISNCSYFAIGNQYDIKLISN